jgi:hypothetical protein
MRCGFDSFRVWSQENEVKVGVFIQGAVFSGAGAN